MRSVEGTDVIACSQLCIGNCTAFSVLGVGALLALGTCNLFDQDPATLLTESAASGSSLNYLREQTVL
jgi:hypothetical protein